MTVLLVGCGYRLYSPQETADYLESRYGVRFNVDSTVELTEATTVPVTSEGETTYNKVEHNDKIYYLYDENGIECRIYANYRIGCSSHYVMRENYCTQWLKNRPDVFEPLDESKFDSGYEEPSADEEYYIKSKYIIYIDKFDDIKPAAELAYSIVGNDRAILPDNGYSISDAVVYSEIPEIVITTADGTELQKMSFRTVQKPYMTDLEVFTACTQSIYADKVNDGVLENDLPDNYIPRINMINVYKKDKFTDVILYYELGHYIVDDPAVKRNEKLEFPSMTRLCKSAGYKVKNSGRNKLVLKKGNDKIVIARKPKGFHKGNELYIEKNGERFYPEGRAESNSEKTVCELTTADYTNLFGIKFEYDFENAKAFINE